MDKKKKIKKLTPKQSTKRIKRLHKEGYKIKKIKLPNGDIAIMKKKV
jgi:hypothetical protein